MTPGSKPKTRRDGRVVEGARLESVYTATYRGFESLSLRQISYSQTYTSSCAIVTNLTPVPECSDVLLSMLEKVGMRAVQTKIIE